MSQFDACNDFNVTGMRLWCLRCEYNIHKKWNLVFMLFIPYIRICLVVFHWSQHFSNFYGIELQMLVINLDNGRPFWVYRFVLKNFNFIYNCYLAMRTQYSKFKVMVSASGSGAGQLTTRQRWILDKCSTNIAPSGGNVLLNWLVNVNAEILHHQD